MTSEADLIFARANVALAKSQRLIASWLPPRTEEELRNAKTAEEIEREEEEIFKPMPELLGLGATPKEENDSVRKELSKDDVLRKRLFGKEFEKMFRKDGERKGSSRQVVTLGASKPMPVEMKRRMEDWDEEDEEEGRSGLGRSKRTGKAGVKKQVQEDSRTGPDDGDDAAMNKTMTKKKRSNNYLDEILAEKQRKKRKKKAKHKVESDDTTGRTNTLQTQ